MKFSFDVAENIEFEDIFVPLKEKNGAIYLKKIFFCDYKYVLDQLIYKKI